MCGGEINFPYARKLYACAGFDLKNGNMFENNHMKMNEDKSHLLIYISGSLIEESDEMKLLGVIPTKFRAILNTQSQGTTNIHEKNVENRSEFAFEGLVTSYSIAIVLGKKRFG